MLIKDLEKLRKRTLRERIYEEIVHLILSGEMPSGGWVDEKQVIQRLRVSRTPFREAIGILAKEGLIEIKPYRGFYVRSFSRDETADIYELYKRLECFAVELAVPQMSDCDIRQFENILLDAMVDAAWRYEDTRHARTRILRNYRRAIRKFGAHRGAEAAWVANPALWHNLRREWGVCRARRKRIRRHHKSVQGAGHSTRRLSRPRPYQLRAGSDSCALP
jgi:DNA-binding GntR family transcriptional regulator